MTRTRLQRLDDLVRWTGIPAFIEQRQRRRRMTLLPTLALVFATTGLLMTWLALDRFLLGYGMLLLSFCVATFLPHFGPLVPFGAALRVDERERALRGSAALIGFAAVGVSAWLGLWVLIALALLQQLAVDRLIHDMTALAFYLVTLYAAVPTLWASWQLRPLPEEN